MAEMLGPHFGGYKKTVASILGASLSLGSVALKSPASTLSRCRPHGEGLMLFNKHTSQAFRWPQL